MKGKYFFILFFLYIIIQGALRKWLVPSLGTPLYLFQYVLVGMFYFVCKKKRSLIKDQVRPAFEDFLMVYVAYGALEMINFRGTDNLIVPLYGFVMHFAFVPMIYYIGRVMESEDRFFSLISWLPYILIPLFMLGITQYFSPQGAFINYYATETAAGEYEVVVGAGGRVRIAGTFSYLATYASFLAFILHMFLFGVFKSLLNNKLSIPMMVAFGLAFINIFMTGSRGPVGYYIISEGLTIFVLIFSGQFKFLNKLVPFALLLVVGYFVIISTEAGSLSIGDFMNRFENAGDLSTRFEDVFSPLKYSEYTGPFGYGIGTAQVPMGGYLTNRNEMPIYWEEEGERIAVEFGIIGYFLIMALRISVFVSCYGVYRRIRTLEYKILALQMTMFQFPFLLNLQTNIFNYIDAIFYWIAVGLVYFAYQMEKQKRAQNQLQDNTQLTSYQWG